MTDDPLMERARRLGVMTEYEGMDGTAVTPPRSTIQTLVGMLDTRDAPPEADLRLRVPDGVRCHGDEDAARRWGVAVQLYQLRSDRNWGIGDFADLADLAALLAAEGADFIGLNPLHAPFLSGPERCSPFSPSDRRMLNPLYIAVDRVPGFDPTLADAATLHRLRGAEHVDYTGVAACKLATLRGIWRGQGAMATPEVTHWARFEVVSAHRVACGDGPTWRDWPVEWQDPNSPTVQEFIARNADEVGFYTWLQTVAADQLAMVRRTCRDAGMAIGLYLDFAVGEDPGGAGSWGVSDVVATARVGAPPDQFSDEGQNWGLLPLSPVRMAETGSEPFRHAIEPVLAQAGAVRIDHAMGLWQLFLIPQDGSAAEGTYVRYPLSDTLRVLAELSHTHRALVVGEDLGNVPRGFRAVMEAAGILSYRILFFERDGAEFTPPADYPVQALACLSTHDLPPFRSWWTGVDNQLREELGLVTVSGNAERAAERQQDRDRLVAALHQGEQEVDPSDMDGLVIAVHRHLAMAPSRLFVARFEDMAGETVAVNVPGTSDDLYPNWRPKLRATFADIMASVLARKVTSALRDVRPAEAD
ncbi:4-alpha-glucanotransferase [Falsirhodobacter halotolerans]|uniref:4-alpha-glucanotransferase n=1 Tax=Falsirhodobacter halotolerans TaxID=1146892 RepID=UPI001FD12815|nr:4-alpha-glucanotransferase [Falsirhodobacter halotolerans]MCJ8139188.1 4-alpha-glucanotransferase [Falsirhodobacter halotolerans]